MYLGQRTRSLGRKRVLHSYDDFLLDNDYRYYCLSRDAVMVIVSLLEKYGLYDSTYYTQLTDNHYITPNQSQYDVIERVVGEAIAEMGNGQTFDMSGVITAIQCVCDKIDELEIAVASGSECGCVTTGTGVIEVTPGTLVECIPPSTQFDLWEDYKTYACKAAVWTFDQLLIFSEKAKNLFFNFHEDWYNGQANDRLGLQQVFQRAAANVGNQFSPLYLYNLAEGNKAFLAQFQASLYYKFATDYFLRVPETDVGQDVIDEWYNDTWNEIQDYLTTQKTTFINNMYNAENATDAKSFLDGLIEGAITQAVNAGGTQLGLTEISDTFRQLKSLGVAQLGFDYVPQLNNFVHSFSCTGDKGCTAPSSCWQSVTIGQHAGGDDWNTVFNPQTGFHEVDIYFDSGVTDIASTNSNGLTSPPGRNIWHVYDNVPAKVYDSDANPASLIANVSRIHVASATSGDIVLTVSCGGA